MKRLLLTSFFAFNLILSLAQNPNGWIQTGAEFYHAYNLNHENGYVRFYLSEEFEVNGKMLQRLSGEKKYRYQTGPDSWVEHPQIIPVSSMLFHTSNDTVYYANEQGELRFAWHLNPQIGDVWNFGTHPLYSADTAITAYGIVTEITPVEIGGLSTFNIRWRSCIDENGTLPPYYEDLENSYLHAFHEGQINTLLGPINNFFFQFFYEIEPMPGAIICFFQSSILACYQSDATNLIHFLPSQSCTNNVVALENSEIFSLQIYPNPASTFVMINHVEQIKSYKIMDATGRLVLSGEEFPIQVDELPRSVYFVELDLVDGTSTKRKLILE
jgi:hypothetical protein